MTCISSCKCCDPFMLPPAPPPSLLQHSSCWTLFNMTVGVARLEGFGLGEVPLEPGGGNLFEIKLLGNQLASSPWLSQTWHPVLTDPCSRCHGYGWQVKAGPSSLWLWRAVSVGGHLLCNRKTLQCLNATLQQLSLAEFSAILFGDSEILDDMK